MEYALKTSRERDCGSRINPPEPPFPRKRESTTPGVWCGRTVQATGAHTPGNSLDEVGQRGASRVPLEPMRPIHGDGTVPNGTGAATTLFEERP